jgi:two-component system cell cycle response regulator
VKQKIRKEDLFARYGGEEFAIVLPEIALEPSLTLAEKIRQLVEQHEFRFENTPIAVTISMGVATMGERSRDLEGLIRSADELLYTAKAEGRNQVRG